MIYAIPSDPATAVPLEDLLARSSALASKAEATSNHEHFKRAKEPLIQALENFPNDHRAYIALAQLELSIITRFPRTPEGEFSRPTSMRKLLDQALNLSPDNLDALASLSKYHEFRSEYEAALAIDEKALKLDPTRKHFNLHASRCLLLLNRHKEAEQRLISIEKSALSTGDIETLVSSQELLGKVYLKQKKFKDAEQKLVSAVKHAKACVIG